ncbi:hypothetical protein ATCC90586_006325 [Pythium insidiosum]|nr:hypothetical protein ATCC90586_006325 [Pythium insidiosum]
MEYVVEEIRGERRIRRKGRSTTKFLVKWAGFNEETWEPISNLSNCRDKIEEFRSRQRGAADEAPAEDGPAEDAVDEELGVSAQADSDDGTPDGAPEVGESEVVAVSDDGPSPGITVREDETEAEVLSAEKQSRASAAKKDLMASAKAEDNLKALEEERKRASLFEAQLRQTEAALIENERIIRGMEIEINQRREKEGKLNDQLELLRQDLGKQHSEITDKEAEIQSLESEILQLRLRGRDDPHGIDAIEHLQIDLQRSQEALLHMQRVNLETVSKLKDKEKEYKSWVDTMKQSDQAYRDLQASSALHETIVAAFKRSTRVEGLIRTVMEDLVQSQRHPEESIMKNMCRAIVGEFDRQTEHFGVETRAAGPLDKLLLVWVKTRNASAHKEEVIGRVDYERYHAIMDVLDSCECKKRQL